MYLYIYMCVCMYMYIVRSIGKLSAIGLGYDTLRERNPRLIYASITGFGQTVPFPPHPCSPRLYTHISLLCAFILQQV